MPAKKAAPAATKVATKAPLKTVAAAPAKAAAGSCKVAIGKKVLAFTSLVTGGGSWKSSAAAGRNLVIYFYPRDNTSGCTKVLYPKSHQRFGCFARYTLPLFSKREIKFLEGLQLVIFPILVTVLVHPISKNSNSFWRSFL